jgi:hypothetical protein
MLFKERIIWYISSCLLISLYYLRLKNWKLELFKFDYENFLNLYVTISVSVCSLFQYRYRQSFCRSRNCRNFGIGQYFDLGSSLERGSERQKSLHRKVRTSNVSLIWSERRKSKRSERRKSNFYCYKN